MVARAVDMCAHQHILGQPTEHWIGAHARYCYLLPMPVYCRGNGGSDMSRLTLYALGTPRIEITGDSVLLDTRKAVALLIYLAVTQQRHSRDALAALLWPDYDEAHARATLRRTLSSLNKALAGDWLAIERDTLGLAVHADLWCDVSAFLSGIAQCRTHGHSDGDVCTDCLPLLADAVALYRDDFLAGFSLRDSTTFEDWQFAQRQWLRQELAKVLDRLSLGYSRLGEYELALNYAQRWLVLDRLHEPAHCRLMQIYAWSGQRGAALRQYQECAHILENELGVAPLEATRRLCQQIREDELAPPGEISVPFSSMPVRRGSDTPIEAMPDAVSTSSSVGLNRRAGISYPFVGRVHEWATLTDLYNSIRGDGCVVLLEGEAGIGKTRLAEEFLAYAHERGATTVAARCFEGEAHLAYMPISSVLRAALAQPQCAHRLEQVAEPWLAEASRLVPEFALAHAGLTAPQAHSGPGAQTRFYEGLRLTLMAACGDTGNARPAVLFIDDVQWADSATCSFLTYMVRRLRGARICLLLAHRRNEMVDDRGIQQLVSEARRQGNINIITLARLGPDDVTELMQVAMPAPHERTSDLGKRLYRETEGLPLFLEAYLTALQEGMLAPEESTWSLPGGVRDLLWSRLHDTSETGSQILATAAVIGRSFDFDIVHEVSGRGEEEVVLALEELAALGLVVELRGETSKRQLLYDFGHEKLRTLVYESTSLARRRLLHRRTAEALLRTIQSGDKGALAGQIARHHLMAGNDAVAAEYFVMAGMYARALYANAEALAHFEMARGLGHADVGKLHEAIGDLQTLLGAYMAALKSYELAIELADSCERARVEHKVGNVYARRGELDLAGSHLEAALQSLDVAEAGGERARIFADWSLIAHRQNAVDRAQIYAQQAMELATKDDEVQALAQAHNILGILASGRGNLDDAVYHFEQSLTLAGRLNDMGVRASALNNLALVLGARGEVGNALDAAAEALALCVAQGDRHHEAALHNNMADLLHGAGQPEAAFAHLKQSVAIYAEIGVEAGSVQPEIWKLAEW